MLLAKIMNDRAKQTRTANITKIVIQESQGQDVSSSFVKTSQGSLRVQCLYIVTCFCCSFDEMRITALNGLSWIHACFNNIAIIIGNFRSKSIHRAIAILPMQKVSIGSLVERVTPKSKGE